VEKITMTHLTQQLEDKKKELNGCELYTKWDKEFNKTEQNKLISDSLNIKLESKEYKDLNVEQQCSLIMTRIAEIAILEQAIAEINELELQNEMLRASFKNAVKTIEKLEEDLQSQQNKIETPKNLVVIGEQNKTGSADISNLLQKQRQEILDFIKEHEFTQNQGGYLIYADDLEVYIKQLNQPKTDENNNTIQNTDD
jgi:metal-dependent amidase/aminoacylase/carboxypeptidase family protein